MRLLKTPRSHNNLLGKKLLIRTNCGEGGEYAVHNVLCCECVAVVFYAPNFKKVGGILLSACPSVRPSVRACVRSSVPKKLKLGFCNFIYGFLIKKAYPYFFLFELSPLIYFFIIIVIFMPPTLKKWEAYCFRLVRPCVCASIRSKKLKLGF